MPPPDAAFDRLAASYDADFTETPIARYLRERVHARLDALFVAGSRVLEIGCGTGEDALHLLRRGVHVTPTDVSEAMRTAAERKLVANGFASVVPGALDLHNLPEKTDSYEFDGVLANFGVLNVLADFTAFSRWLAARVRPGGAVALGVMAPRCLWEFGWHALHGDFLTASRRWRQNTTFRAGDGPEIPIYYPFPQILVRHFSPYFEKTLLAPLGLFLPPSDVFGAVEKRPALLRTLITLDEVTREFAWLAPYADHYWIELRRTDAPTA